MRIALSDSMTVTSPQSLPLFHSASFSRATTRGTQALKEICGTMFGIELEPAGPIDALDASSMTYGGCVTLFHEEGTWEFALYGTDATAMSLARAVLFMEPDEEPEDTEVLDVLGEMVNMVAGSAKMELPKGTADEASTASPMFMLGQDCAKHLPHAIPVQAQAFKSTNLDGLIYLAWCEVTPAALVDEIACLLEEYTENDKLGPSQMISHFLDIDEFLPEESPDELRNAVEGCESVLTEVVNDQIEARLGIEVVKEVVKVLALALDPSGTKVAPEEIPDPRRSPALAAAAKVALASEERDEDIVDMLGDFLQESADGLEEVDAVLIDAENGTVDEETVNRLFRTYHSMKGASSFLELNDITSLSHTTETLLAKVRDGDAKLAGPVLDLIFDSTALTRVLLTGLQGAIENSTVIPSNPLLEELIKHLEAGIAGEFIESTAPRPDAVAAPAADATPKPAGKTKIKQTLKIDLSLVEELESAVSELGRITKDFDAPKELQEISDQVASISAQIRMVTLGGVFQKMTRMVRDLCKKTEKVGKVAVTGEDTKVPRTLVEGLNDPLVHMIRNAVDHGLETQEERSVTSKPMLATISLSAYRQGENVIVELSEDGRGMSAAKLIEKAKEKGVLDAEAELTDAEAYMLIFAPGFSTAAQVTAISGRGVGMDVVRRNVEGLGGHIEVLSTLGSGSTFRLILPLIRPSDD